MQIKVDQKAEAAYVQITDEPVARTQPKSEQLIVDYDAKGGIVGIEILDIGEGVDLGSDLPRELTAELEPLLDKANIRMMA
jgi:uncharacterized protein YuzE